MWTPEGPTLAAENSAASLRFILWGLLHQNCWEILILPESWRERILILKYSSKFSYFVFWLWFSDLFEQRVLLDLGKSEWNVDFGDLLQAHDLAVEQEKKCQDLQRNKEPSNPEPCRQNEYRLVVEKWPGRQGCVWIMGSICEFLRITSHIHERDSYWQRSEWWRTGRRDSIVWQGWTSSQGVFPKGYHVLSWRMANIVFIWRED